MAIPYINIHSHHAGREDGITLRSYRMGIGDPLPPKPFSAGIHPWDADRIANPAEVYEQLRGMDIAAVGEIGLDKASDSNYPRQMELFAGQVAIAAERSLPVIIHCVRAFEDVMKELCGHRLSGVIFHGYTGSLQQTEIALKSGCYMSLGKASLKSPKTIESLLAMPVDRLFLETDDTCADIAEVYAEVAVLLGIPVDSLKETIYENYKKLFGKI